MTIQVSMIDSWHFLITQVPQRSFSPAVWPVRRQHPELICSLGLYFPIRAQRWLPNASQLLLQKLHCFQSVHNGIFKVGVRCLDICFLIKHQCIIWLPLFSVETWTSRPTQHIFTPESTRSTDKDFCTCSDGRLPAPSLLWAGNMECWGPWQTQSSLATWREPLPLDW